MDHIQRLQYHLHIVSIVDLSIISISPVSRFNLVVVFDSFLHAAFISLAHAPCRSTTSCHQQIMLPSSSPPLHDPSPPLQKPPPSPPKKIDASLPPLHFTKRAKNSPLHALVPPGESTTNGTNHVKDDHDAESLLISSRVAELLREIARGGEGACLDVARRLDFFHGETVVVTPQEVQEQTKGLSEQTKEDIAFQQARVRAFAEETLRQSQSSGGGDTFEAELFPGLTTGQKTIPLRCAGCYVPGGRYSHVSSATMSVVTAKTAGVETVVACSPPMKGTSDRSTSHRRTASRR